MGPGVGVPRTEVRAVGAGDRRWRAASWDRPIELPITTWVQSRVAGAENQARAEHCPERTAAPDSRRARRGRHEHLRGAETRDGSGAEGNHADGSYRLARIVPPLQAPHEVSSVQPPEQLSSVQVSPEDVQPLNLHSSGVDPSVRAHRPVQQLTAVIGPRPPGKLRRNACRQTIVFPWLSASSRRTAPPTGLPEA